ncbi:MAG: exodeoxyribonuclease VII large subunit [Myxococcota bacterium]
MSTGETLSLFAPRAPKAPPVLTVTQVNNLARNELERQFPHITVVAEVSNCKIISGHCYFTLKDRTSQLAAVLFKRDAARLKFALEVGQEVVVVGRLTIYGAYGRYQLVAESIEPRGVGALQTAFEQLKKRLADEGLFAVERKRPLPKLPARVAVVSSAEGAVIRDIIQVATRRCPNAQILLIPTRVQGRECATQVAYNIDRISRLTTSLGIDVIIVARGGGSLEDLWGFNDERVARAIVAAPVPVVSAVGHETDFCIADFVADARAPTPSAAAELVFPVYSDLQYSLQRYHHRSATALRRQIDNQRHHLRAVASPLERGRRLIGR